MALDRAEILLGRTAQLVDLRHDDVAADLRKMTVACASAGNHGRSVAYGARLAGIGCKVFVHSAVSEKRMALIAALGAEIIRFDGSYDDSVAETARQCTAKGWILVSDTSVLGPEEPPVLVMQGYTVLAQEIAAQMALPPTHLFLQAGVGGMAAAVAAHLALLWGERRPKVIIVEPDSAACFLESARAGRALRISGGPPTAMTMLECYEPSPLAWRVLAPLADHFLAIPDHEAQEIRTRLAAPYAGDPVILAGLSGCAGLAGLSSLAHDPDARARLGLNRQSRVLAVLSEGPNDLATTPSH
jgi:diaminopropionate ammonia-lyase